VDDTEAESENALRLRALVRVVVSPGIWAIILIQVLIQLLGRHEPVTEEDAGAAFLRMFAGTVTIVAMLYFQAGVFAVLSRTRGPVTLPAVLRDGRNVFFLFVWLIVRAALVLAGIGMLAGTVVIGSLGVSDPQAIAQKLAAVLTVTAVLLPFLFVYWLPYVFVNNDFRLFASFRQALVLFWQRRMQGWYLALLILLPAVFAGMLPSATPFAVRLVLGGAIMLLAWAANTYCVEWLVARRKADPVGGETAS